MSSSLNNRSQLMKHIRKAINTFSSHTDILKIFIFKTVSVTFSIFFFFFLFFQTVKIDFEDSSHLPNVRNNRHPDPVSQTPSKFKEGSNSMKWLWGGGGSGVGEILEWDLAAKNIHGRPARLGGIKFHLYNTQPISGKCLKMCIRQETTKTGCGGTTLTSCFFTSLNFKGWRAVWVSYKEFHGCQDAPTKDKSCFEKKRIEKFTIEAPQSAAPDPVYLDDLKFVDTIHYQTRDTIVPPIRDKSGNCFSCTDFASGITEADALKRHPRKDFWDQTYRWHLVERSTSPPSGPAPSTTDLRDLLTIKKRLLSWYVGDDISFHSPNLVKTRWESLLGKSAPSSKCDSHSGNIKCSHLLFSSPSSHLSGEGLYCRNCDKAKRKFDFVFQKMLLPMAIDYRIWSEAEKRACMLANLYGCNPLTTSQLSEFKSYITGYNHPSLTTEFDSQFPNTRPAPSPESPHCTGVSKTCLNSFITVIRKLNDLKKEKIVEIFKYVRDQGFQEGSSLGSQGHQMLTGSGYMHAAFLTADVINDVNDPEMTLQNLIDTMKWYSDIGELYQQPKYEYHGTTADRVRTLTHFKLLTIMSMPESNDDEKRKKIRDMTKLKKLIDNSLVLTQGLFGLLKPDYLAFHHFFYYGGYYVADAIHTLSLITYFLDNTNFKLSDASELNLHKALEFQRIIAVKYSFPPSVDGRYPFYYGLQLAKRVPSYLYLAIESPTLDLNDELNSMRLNTSSIVPGIYKRLTDPPIDCTCSKTVCPLTVLCAGKVASITYLNSLGQAEMIENIRALLPSKENSPRGNWAKNYAALSVHRRDDWAVTVKGFNHYVLGPERYVVENVYGLYSSHGAMLIANNEESLKTKNVDGGWDWTKLPGTTAVEMTDDEIGSTISSRYKNQKALAGGVSFYGTKTGAGYANGVFGMAFEMPSYTKKQSKVLSGHKFLFKKSVFFFDNVLVCLGSNIESDVPSKNVITSLFQDTAWTTTSSSSPSSPPKFYCNNGNTELKKYDFSAKTTLVDRNGNKYYIPGAVSSQLKFHRNVHQTHKTQSGKKDGSGTYCKAWFDHGATPSNANYQYIIEVNAVPSPHNQPADTHADINIGDYQIFQQTEKIHTVKHSSMCGHVIFDKSARIPQLSGCPVRRATEPCIIMTKLTSSPSKILEISISFPQMNLDKDPSLVSDPALCAPSLPSPTVGATHTSTSMLFCTKDIGKNIKLYLQFGYRPLSITTIEVDGTLVDPVHHSRYADIVSPSRLIHIKDLKHGKSMDLEIKCR